MASIIIGKGIHVLFISLIAWSGRVIWRTAKGIIKKELR